MILNRIKKAWALSKMEDVIYIPKKSFTEEELEIISKAKGTIIPVDDLNDKAEFFSEPTRQDEIEYERDQNGTLPWYKRIKNLL